MELPKEGEFIAKNAVGEDLYMNLSTFDIYHSKISINRKNKPIFGKVLRVGIGRKENDFFKKEYIMLSEKLSQKRTSKAQTVKILSANMPVAKKFFIP